MSTNNSRQGTAHSKNFQSSKTICPSKRKISASGPKSYEFTDDDGDKSLEVVALDVADEVVATQNDTSDQRLIEFKYLKDAHDNKAPIESSAFTIGHPSFKLLMFLKQNSLRLKLKKVTRSALIADYYRMTCTCVGTFITHYKYLSFCSLIVSLYLVCLGGTLAFEAVNQYDGMSTCYLIKQYIHSPYINHMSTYIMYHISFID